MNRSNYRRAIAWWLDNGNHRNQYCVGVNPGPNWASLDRLLRLDLMRAGPKINNGRDIYLYVTNFGIARAKKEFQCERPRRPHRRRAGRAVGSGPNSDPSNTGKHK